MITHYLKVAVRNLLKYKTQNFISILGLAVGLFCFYLSSDSFVHIVEHPHGCVSGQDDGIAVVCYLFPASTDQGWGEYLVIKAVHLHSSQFIGKQFTFLANEVILILYEV